MNKVQKREGFTIIEVVLVLAIAGLIFLIVFLAVPALQRSQRDTQRKNDLSRFMSQISSYQSNAQGNVPAATAAAMTTATTGFVDKYMLAGGDTWQDPNGSAYAFQYGAGAGPVWTTNPNTIRYSTSATCSTATAGDIVAATGTRKVAASVALEGGGAYCQNN